MTDSGAVYQPTTVGYTYDTGGDGTVGGSRLRNGFLRIVSRRKISLKKWFEWVLLSVALCFFVAGLTMILVSLVSTDDSVQSTPEKEESKQTSTTMATETKEHVNNESGSSIAFDITMILVGLLMGSAWVWMRFFRRSKSPRNGIIGNSGQMLGGLNPSTDLLVGSTSQYGPVLTELPSQLKLKQVVTPHDVSTAIPLSDQEEETRTLMQDSTVPSTISAGPTSINNQIPG